MSPLRTEILATLPKFLRPWNFCLISPPRTKILAMPLAGILVSKDVQDLVAFVGVYFHFCHKCNDCFNHHFSILGARFYGNEEVFSSILKTSDFLCLSTEKLKNYNGSTNNSSCFQLTLKWLSNY